MSNKPLQKVILRLFILFLVIDVLALAFSNWLDEHKIDHFVVIGANLLLLLIATGTLVMQSKAAANPNPNVFVRSVMGGTFVKLMVVVVAIVIYIVAAGKNKSVYAVFVGLALYIVYTVIEVKGLLQLNRRQNGSN